MKKDMFQLLSTALILLDTSTIMQPQFEMMVNNLLPRLQNNKLILLKSSWLELERLARKNDPRKAEIARESMRILDRLIAKNVIDTRYDEANKTTHNDDVILGIVQKYHSSRDVIVFTNDHQLGEDIHHILFQKSISHNHCIQILALKDDSIVDKTAIYNKLLGMDSFDSGHELKSHKKEARFPNPFRPSQTLAPEVLNSTQIKVSESIASGSTVHTHDLNCPNVVLGDVISAGGEGTVHKTNIQGVVCKIYYDEKLTTCLKAKVELLVSRSVPREQGICLPIASVYDTQNKFRGFLMWEAKGTKLQDSVQSPGWLENHKEWTRFELAQLCCTILEKISYIHSMNILLGDINSANILVESPTSVWFVDCDSFQVEGFPCPVGVPSYTAPELHGTSFGSRLRTMENELFSVAILLFMIMLPGKHPYAHQGGGDPAENIRKGHFPYPLGEKHADCVPEGKWRYCWSHLPWPIKNDFYNCFHRDGFGNPRTVIKTWLYNFRRYCKILKNRDETFVGPRQQYGFDLMIFPHNLRRVVGKNTLRTDGKTDLQARSEALMAELEAEIQAQCAQQTTIKPQPPIYVQAPVYVPLQPKSKPVQNPKSPAPVQPSKPAIPVQTSALASLLSRFFGYRP